MKYVYIQTEPKLWTVGHYQSDGKLYPESDHATPDKAAERAAYLNGALNRSLQSQLLDLRKQYDEMRAEMLGVLRRARTVLINESAAENQPHLVGALEKVSACIEKYSSEPTEAQKEDVRKNGVPEDQWREKPPGETL